MAETRNKTIQNAMRNTGYQILKPSNYADEKKTIVVLGCARSGTSMVTGIINKLGVFVGEHHDNATYEDVNLSNAFESNDIDKAESIINTYNDKYDTWAWKRPGLINYFDTTKGKLRNPHYIVIFKDIFSIANRNKISMDTDLLKNMQVVLRDHQKLLEILSTLDDPCLILSNEKVLQNKEEIVQTISDFVGVGGPDEIKKAIKFINPNRTTYLENTRKNRSIGHQDSLTKNKVAGWAKSVFNKDEHVEVELLVNGEVAKVVTADAYREDLKKIGHGSGKFGFNISLDDLCLNKGDLVGVKVKGDIFELKNSPMKYK